MALNRRALCAGCAAAVHGVRAGPDRLLARLACPEAQPGSGPARAIGPRVKSRRFASVRSRAAPRTGTVPAPAPQMAQVSPCRRAGVKGLARTAARPPAHARARACSHERVRSCAGERKRVMQIFAFARARPCAPPHVRARSRARLATGTRRRSESASRPHLLCCKPGSRRHVTRVASGDSDARAAAPSPPHPDSRTPSRVDSAPGRAPAPPRKQQRTPPPARPRFLFP
jgi:hypothetical protein